MATAIHHGAPGSYKTFTLVQRHAIDALKAGRAVVTNIRGFNQVDNVKAAYPEIAFPDTARIIWVDTTTKEGRHKMACWFHWIPFGALVIIDELQQIYPERRDFKMEFLDKYIPVPGEFIEDINHPEGRPEDIFVAFDKQRHYNWDVFGSTTNIAKVKKEIRQVADWAYRHRNMSGVLPWWKDRWREFQHDPENSGKSVSHYAGSPKDYQADKRVFKCYSSTATGLHTGTKTSESLFKDPKLQFIGLVILVCLGIIVWWFFRPSGIKAAIPDPVAVPNPPLSDVANLAPDTKKPALPNVSPVADKSPLELDLATIRKLSVHGVEAADLDRIPLTCRVNTHHVACSLPRSIDLVRVATDYYCDDFVCMVYFYPKPPDNDPQKRHLIPSTVLANAFP